MTLIQKIKEIATIIPKYCNKQAIKGLFDESARVSNEYLRNQISYIDNLKNTSDIKKAIYKADVILKTVFGENLLEG